MAEPMTDARLVTVRGLLPHSDWSETQDIARELLAEVDYQRAEVDRLRAENSDLKTASREIDNKNRQFRAMADERDAALGDCEDVVNETLPNLRQDREGWQRTAAELTEALRAHVIDWGSCDAGPGCDCSHTRAVMLLIREGALDDEHGETDEEPDVIEITDDDLLTILRGPLARADDHAETTVTVDTAALRLALDAWARARSSTREAEGWNKHLRSEVARLRAVHTGIRRLITAWERRPQPRRIRTTGAARILREILGGEDVAFADEPAELTADHTLRTAAGQGASDE